VIDPAWYGDDPRERDAVLRRLPTIAWAPRAGHRRPETGIALAVDDDHHEVSASAVRSGRHVWMLPEAKAYADRTGAWIDPERYRTVSTAPADSATTEAGPVR